MDKESEELDRLEKLFKKHEMGEIPRIEWLDQLVFRGVEKRGLQASSTSLKALRRRRTRNQSTVMTLDGTDENQSNGDKERKILSRALLRMNASHSMLNCPGSTSRSSSQIMSIHHHRSLPSSICLLHSPISYSSHHQKFIMDLGSMALETMMIMDLGDVLSGSMTLKLVQG